MSNAKVKIIAGTTLPKGTFTVDDDLSKLPSHHCCSVDASAFQIRGAHYKKKKAKLPSLPAYYELMGVE
jgi:hypothetical protein